DLHSFPTRRSSDLHFVALLEVLHRLLARQAPRQVREVHQAVDAAREADEDAEIGDRLDLALDAVALLELAREIVPGIRQALLHAERDAAALLVDLEEHDFD